MLSGKDDVKTSLSNEMEDVEKRKTELTVRGFAARCSLLTSLRRLLDADQSTQIDHQKHLALPSPVETDVPAAQAPVAGGKPEGPDDQRDGLGTHVAQAGGLSRGAVAVGGRWQHHVKMRSIARRGDTLAGCLLSAPSGEADTAPSHSGGGAGGDLRSGSAAALWGLDSDWGCWWFGIEFLQQ